MAIHPKLEVLWRRRKQLKLVIWKLKWLLELADGNIQVIAHVPGARRPGGPPRRAVRGIPLLEVARRELKRAEKTLKMLDIVLNAPNEPLPDEIENLEIAVDGTETRTNNMGEDE